jgi:hypothetical protein
MKRGGLKRIGAARRGGRRDQAGGKMGGYMRRTTLVVLMALLAWIAVPEASFAQSFGCACVHNRTGVNINFRYRWGGQPWKVHQLLAGYQSAMCWRYGDASHSSPPLNFQIDRDMGPGTAWTTYNITRIQSYGDTCASVAANGHYSISFQPGTNNSLIVVTRDYSGPTQTDPYQYGCACIHNQTGRQINYRYSWGAGPWKVYHLFAGNETAMCWRYSPGSHSSPALRFQIDRDMGPGTAWTTYGITRVQSPGSSCAAVPSNGHYNIAFQPGSNGSLIHVTRRY